MIEAASIDVLERVPAMGDRRRRTRAPLL